MRKFLGRLLDVLFLDVQQAAAAVHGNKMVEGMTQLMMKVRGAEEGGGPWEGGCRGLRGREGAWEGAWEGGGGPGRAGLCVNGERPGDLGGAR